MSLAGITLAVRRAGNNGQISPGRMTEARSKIQALLVPPARFGRMPNAEKISQSFGIILKRA
jgi:hypothetical protein